MSKKIEIYTGVKALIFDIDGTLADTMPTHFKAFQTVLSKYGVEFTWELFNSLAGVPVTPQMYLLKDMFNLDNFEPELVGIEKEEEYARTLSEMKPILPVVDVVLEHVGKMPIGCGTGADSAMAIKTLKVINVYDKVDAVVACDHVEHGKPAPDTFLKCAELLGVEPQYCQVFEDGKPGIEAAIAAGMKVTDVTEYL